MATLDQLRALMLLRQMGGQGVVSAGQMGGVGMPGAAPMKGTGPSLVAGAGDPRQIEPNVPEGYHYGQWGPAGHDEMADQVHALQAARADAEARGIGGQVSALASAQPQNATHPYGPDGPLVSTGMLAAHYSHPQLPAQASPVAVAAVAEHHDANSGETHPDFGTPAIHPANDPAHPFRRNGQFKPGLFHRSGGDRARALTY